MTVSQTPTPPSSDAAPESTFGKLCELFDARWAMAQLEIRHNISAAKRLAIVGGVGAVLALTALPILVIAASTALSSITTLDETAWRLILGGGLLLLGLAAMLLSWRTFRGNFTGLSETASELQEDRRWLQELAGEAMRRGRS